MPMPDPLEGIMGQLRSKGAVEPGMAAHRQAQMGIDRRQMGMAPGMQLGEKPPHDELSGVLQQIGEVKAEPGVAVAPGDMLPILVDQINEAIITLKVQIGRTPDADMRKNLEQKTKSLRQMVMDIGGDPIRADESVDDGLQRIQGFGQVGGEQLRQRLGLGPSRSAQMSEALPAQAAPQIMAPPMRAQAPTGRVPLRAQENMTSAWGRIGARFVGRREVT